MSLGCEMKCGGHCCKAFVLPFSPSEFERNKQATINNESLFLSDAGTHQLQTVRCNIPEQDVITAMVQYKGLLTEQPSTGEKVLSTTSSGNKRDTVNDQGEPAVHVYTCKNLNDNGLCSIYQTRPRMCRDYPYGNKCEYTNCCKNK